MMMATKEFFKSSLTNEKVKANCANQFDLVNNAIRMAREIIRGRITSAETDNLNVAVQALMELNEQEVPRVG
jgi:hypothetical protein